MNIKIEIEEGSHLTTGSCSFDPNNVKCPICGETMELHDIGGAEHIGWMELSYDCPNCNCKTKMDASIDTYY